MAMVKEYGIVLKLNGTLGNLRQPETFGRGVLFISMSFYAIFVK